MSFLIEKGSFEIYDKVISDLLTVKPINSYQEINTVWANIGSTQSKGIGNALSTLNIDRPDLQMENNTYVFAF